MQGKEIACAVICEYNPFHYGHRYQLARLHERYSTVVCLLGGNLTQRGEVAIADRFVRAIAALRGGADLVLELPLPWCCASAADFARGGVQLAKAIGVDALAFSAESDPEPLRDAAKRRALAEREARERMRSDGTLSYPRLLELALGRELAGKPNDILGIEYLAIAEQLSLPTEILRRNTSFSSSGEIRGSADVLSHLPEESASVFESDASFPRRTRDAGLFALASIRNTTDASVYAVPPELLARLKQKTAECADWDSFVSSCTGKLYTAARVRRAAWAVTFGFPAVSEWGTPYTTLLAANERGRAFLRSHPQANEHIAYRRLAHPLYELNERVNAVLSLFYGNTDCKPTVSGGQDGEGADV